MRLTKDVLEGKRQSVSHLVIPKRNEGLFRAVRMRTVGNDPAHDVHVNVRGTFFYAHAEWLIQIFWVECNRPVGCIFTHRVEFLSEGF